MIPEDGRQRPRQLRSDRIVLITPCVNRPGELIIRWDPASAHVKWDANLGALPAAAAFERCLDKGWADELIQRLNAVGFAWEFSERIYMLHQSGLKRVPHEIAEFVRETLPPVFSKATARFSELHPAVKREPFKPRVPRPVVKKRAQPKVEKVRQVFEAGSD